MKGENEKYKERRLSKGREKDRERAKSGWSAGDVEKGRMVILEEIENE